jgi:hypothetical protein
MARSDRLTASGIGSVTQLGAAKVSKSNFRSKQQKFCRHFKGVFWNGNMEVRILPGQPGSPRFREFPSLDEKGPPNAGFSHRKKSLETHVRTFWVKNSQKSPAESRKTPVFRRRFLETEE